MVQNINRPAGIAGEPYNRPAGTAGENIDCGNLRHYVEEIESLEEERLAATNKVRAVFRDAKQDGISPTALRQMIKERQLAPETRAAHYALITAYRDALGLFADTPLGEAALERAGSIDRPAGIAGGFPGPRPAA